MLGDTTRRMFWPPRVHHPPPSNQPNHPAWARTTPFPTPATHWPPGARDNTSSQSRHPSCGPRCWWVEPPWLRDGSAPSAVLHIPRDLRPTVGNASSLNACPFLAARVGSGCPGGCWNGRASPGWNRPALVGMGWLGGGGIEIAGGGLPGAPLKQSVIRFDNFQRNPLILLDPTSKRNTLCGPCRGPPPDGCFWPPRVHHPPPL